MANLRRWQAQNGPRAKSREENVTVHAISRYAPASVKQAIVEQNYDAALEGLGAAIRGDGESFCPTCHRDGGPAPWAIRAWLEAAGAVGSPHVQIAIAQFVTERLNAGSEQEAAALIESGKRFEQIKNDVEDSWESHLDNGLELVKGVLKLHPERKAYVLAELGLSGEANGKALQAHEDDPVTTNGGGRGRGVKPRGDLGCTGG